MEGTGADGDVWARARQHDGAAFAELYRLHADRVYTHLYQRTRSRDDSEDLTAEVFATAWRKRETVGVHPTAGILPWLLLCANHLLRNRGRSIGRARQLLAKVPRVVVEPDVAQGVVDDAEDKWNLHVLSEILTTLRPADQDVIQLCVVQGIAPQTVAELSGERAGTVRSRLSRALARVRELHADRPSTPNEDTRSIR